MTGKGKECSGGRVENGEGWWNKNSRFQATFNFPTHVTGLVRFAAFVNGGVPTIASYLTAGLSFATERVHAGNKGDEYSQLVHREGGPANLKMFSTRLEGTVRAF